MAGLATYYNPETSNTCDACSATSWNTAIDCDDCEGPVCDCCGAYDGDTLLCKRCFARREADRRQALEIERGEEPTNTLWRDHEEKCAETAEIRIPAARTDRLQAEIDFIKAS